MVSLLTETCQPNTTIWKAILRNNEGDVSLQRIIILWDVRRVFELPALRAREHVAGLISRNAGNISRMNELTPQ